MEMNNSFNNFYESLNQEPYSVFHFLSGDQKWKSSCSKLPFSNHSSFVFQKELLLASAGNRTIHITLLRHWDGEIRCLSMQPGERINQLF